MNIKIAAAAALALSGCTISAGSITSPTVTFEEQPQDYSVDARYSSAWFDSSWFHLEIVDGEVASATPIDGDARMFASNAIDGGAEFFVTPERIVAEANNPEPDDASGLNLEYTVERDADGNVTSVCWDDPLAFDEEGCLLYDNYGGDHDHPAPPATAWDEPADYTYVLGYSSFSPWAGVYTVTVRDHAVVSVEPIESFGGPMELTVADAWTVREILDLYDLAAASEKGEATVEWDETGNPTKVDLDWDLLTIDEEQYFEISEITPLEGDTAS